MQCMQHRADYHVCMPFLQYNRSKWKGHVLRVEVAKLNYINKLQKEWSEPDKPAKPPKRKVHAAITDDGEEGAEEEFEPGTIRPFDPSKPFELVLGYRKRKVRMR